MRIRRRRLPSLFLLLASVGTLAACGGDDPTGLVPTAGSVSALVDGTQWTAVIATGANTGGIVAVGASDASGAGIGFAFQGTVADTTYVIGTGAAHNAHYTAGGTSWAANGFTGSGSIVVMTLTATRVTGTFSFEGASSTGGSPATRSITQGMFDVTF
jgi:hypothetical protein